MSQPDQENSGSSRWWEFYAVRYGMGTVVGGVVFFFLCNTNPAFIIKEASELLKQGKVILYPTDTVWGIGCDACNENAVDRIFEIKKRPAEKEHDCVG